MGTVEMPRSAGLFSYLYSLWHLVQALCRPNPTAVNGVENLAILFHLNSCQTFLPASSTSSLPLLGQLLSQADGAWG